MFRLSHSEYEFTCLFVYLEIVIWYYNTIVMHTIFPEHQVPVKHLWHFFKIMLCINLLSGVHLSARFWVKIRPQCGVVESWGAGEAGERSGCCGSLSSGWTERFSAVPPAGLQRRLPDDITAKPLPLPGGWLCLSGSANGDHHQRHTRQPEGTF